MLGTIDFPMILAILPAILVVVLAILVLILDMILSEDARRSLGWITAIGLGLIMFISLVSRPQTEPQLLWGGMIRHDWMGFIFTQLFLFGGAITALFAMDFGSISKRGEFYALLLVSILGMVLLASSADLIMLYLALETVSIPLYILAGFFVESDKSTESGFKYFLFGALTSAIMLFGLSLLYGFTGTTNLYGLSEAFQAQAIPTLALVGSLMLILIGFGFKISAVPLHFWAPDVYDGSPTPVAGFLSTASKAAGFAILLRVLLVGFASVQIEWGAVLAAMAVATMTLGNLIALAQKNIKRLLAYSSIAHAGYILIGVVSISYLGVSSAVFYLIGYLLTNLAAFGVVIATSRVTGSDEISSYAGLSRRSPGLALVMLVALLSLAGMPPFAGFVTKVFIFAAAIQAELIWLAVVGVLNAIIGLYYYLTVLKYVYLYRSEEEQQPLPLTRSYALALGILTVGIIVVGTLFGPWFNWATTAAAALF